MPITETDREAFERCIAAGGVALFPTDTVYGLAVDPHAAAAIDRLYRLKRRPSEKRSALMFFSLDAARAALPDLPDAAARLLPGPVTLLLPQPDSTELLGLRVPRLEGPLTRVRMPVLQSSANLSGGADPRRLGDVESPIRAGVDLELDGGELPGTPSTVVDLSRPQPEIVRPGALSAAEILRLLNSR